tara:strand:+ start:5727 stop:7400 length:1674 start_codon:yes stop_codon:yes gene_type:complete
MIDSKPNLITYLFKEYIKENKLTVSVVTGLSVIIALIQTHGINAFVAKLIEYTKDGSKDAIWNAFYILCGLYVLYQSLYYIFYEFQNSIIYTMKPWGRYKLLDMIMQVNTINFSEENFASLVSPMNRVADLFAWLLSDMASYIFPDVIFTLITGFYFFQLDAKFSGVFLIGNALIILFYMWRFKDLEELNLKYEHQMTETEEKMIDMLNNMDKIVFRAKANEESLIYKKLADRNTQNGLDYQRSSNITNTGMHVIMTIIYLVSIGFLVNLSIKKKIKHVDFITSFTLLMVFREKLIGTFEQLPQIISYFGRIENATNHMKHVNDNFMDIVNKPSTKKYNLKFENFKFENVHYKYQNSDKMVLKNKNLEINPQKHSIVGITGPSGCGKSTILKLLIKVYPLQSGKILIDGVDIKDMDPFELRKDITYVNQNAKLFDKKVVENMFYGCNDTEKCKSFLDQVMKYPKVAKLYQNVDINNKKSGQSGENLSGGQRQVVNLISGFINPSKILILDEPTNALDPELKREVIQIIQDLKKYKQNVFIISHDQEVFKIFDEEIKM